MSKTKRPRRILRSIAAVLAGLVVVIVITTATDALMYATGILPPWGQPMADSLFVLALVYRTIYGIAGGYITARLAPHNPVKHALVLGVIGFVLGSAGTIATWNRGPEFGPKWYALAVIALAIPAAWIGGKFAPRLNHSAAKLSRRYFLQSSAAAVGALLLGCRPERSSSSLPAKLVGLRALMEAQRASSVFPGAVWLVAQGDDVAVDLIGTQAIGGTAPMQRDTIFRIASMTKAVTAACVMMLIDDGKVELEAPAQRWLPELANRRVLRRIDGSLDDTVPAKRDITVRDLLAYTLGFGMLFTNPPIQQRIAELKLVGQPFPLTPHSPDEWMRLFATLPLMHQPGEAWMYGTGSLLQGVLVRRASGQEFDAFMHERIFGPLGMKDTGFFVPPNKLGRYAGCGVFTEQGKQTRSDKDGAESAYAKPPVFPAGNDGLVSTVDDYLIFARMLLNGGKHGNKQILRAESVREMTRDQITPEQKSASAKNFFPGFFDTQGWGYGLAISTAPDPISKVPGRYGWFGGFGTEFIVDPKRDLISIVMTQSTDYLFNGARDRFSRELYTATA